MNLSVIIHAKGQVPIDLREASDGGPVVPMSPWTTDLHQEVTHRVVLTPAVKPCDSFQAHAWRLAGLRPDDPICLLPHGTCFRDAYRQGKSWCSSVDGLCMDAMLLPQALIDKWTAWRAWATSKYAPDEDTLVAYLWSYGKRILHPMPSPVMHRTNDAIWLADVHSTWKDEEPIAYEDSLRTVGPDVLLGRVLQDGLKAHYDHGARRWTCEAANQFKP